MDLRGTKIGTGIEQDREKRLEAYQLQLQSRAEAVEREINRQREAWAFLLDCYYPLSALRTLTQNWLEMNEGQQVEVDDTSAERTIRACFPLAVETAGDAETAALVICSKVDRNLNQVVDVANINQFEIGIELAGDGVTSLHYLTTTNIPSIYSIKTGNERYGFRTYDTDGVNVNSRIPTDEDTQIIIGLIKEAVTISDVLIEVEIPEIDKERLKIADFTPPLKETQAA